LRAILLKLPPDLVAEIDALAAADRRPRTKMIEVMLVEAVQRYQHRSAA
jgi:predicted transcriptional regulator